MKARDVSVGIQDIGGELIVIARFHVTSVPLEREVIASGTRVKESARKRKEKEIQKLLESVEYPND